MKRIIFFVLFVSSFSGISQTPLHVFTQKYTSTGFTVFNVNGACYGSGLTMAINGVNFTNFTYGYCASGICQFLFPFGTLKVGDNITITDACGTTSLPIPVVDDYVYVEVPAGNSYTGNGISPSAQYLPYGQLSNPINVGKCETIDIGSHTLHGIQLLVSLNAGGTTGVYKVNGSPINSSQFVVDNFGNTASSFVFNPNGSLTVNGSADIFSTLFYSGQSLVTLEYTNNGVVNTGLEFTLGPLSIQMSNGYNQIFVKEFLYDGSIQSTTLNRDFSASTFKFTFDNGTFKLYIDGVEEKSVTRTVKYNASSGTLSNNGLLPYTSRVNWTPSASGTQWVEAIMDGRRVARQYFNVAADMVLNASVTNETCGANGSISASITGGQAPIQYSKDNVSFSSNPVFTGLTAGNYTIYAKDASGCTASKVVNVGATAALTLGITSSTNANCQGQSNGSVTLAASGGTSPYQYGINDANYQSSSTISNLGNGAYLYWVSDAAGCKSSTSGNIGLNSSLQASVLSAQNLLCNGDNTGLITLASSGTPSGTVQFSKDGLSFQSGSSFGSLAAGNYQFTVKDNLCSINLNSSISEPAVLNLSPSIDAQVSCFGGSNGSISLSASGGTAAYTYSKDNSTFASSPVFGSLTAANYKFWVKDANNCVAFTPIQTISQPTDISFSVSSKIDVGCFGGNDGSVTLLASGGVASYVFSRDNVSFQSSAVLSNFNAGLKTLYVRDQNACVKSVTSTLLEPPVLTLALTSSTNLVCNTDNSGTILVTAGGGTLPYQYLKNASASQSSSNFTGLAAGSYVITVRDNKNCETSTPSVLLTEPSAISISNTLKVDIDCETYSNGALSFIASGSNGGFSYSLAGTGLLQNTLPSQNAANGVFENLGAGNYTLTATDSRACSKSIPASIVPKNSGIRFDINKTIPTACTIADGSINVVNIGGGRPNPAYNIRISSQPSFGTQASFTGLANGNYFITVADELCSYTKPVDLRIPNSLNIGHTISPINCLTPNANVSLGPIAGGNGSYLISFAAGAFATNAQFNNLKPNTYTWLVQDTPISCVTALSIEVKEQNRADLKTSFSRNISCNGGSDGILRAIGDNNLAPFTYSFANKNNFTPNNEFGGLRAGSYKIYARNSIGCVDSIKASLTEPTVIVWSSIEKNNDCFGDNTGEINLTASGGTPPYLFSIRNEFVDQSKFNFLLAGNYELKVKDNNGCTFDKKVSLTEPPELIIKPFYQDTISCFGLANGSIRIESNGGTPGYIYTLNGIDQDQPIFSNLKVGTYGFTVKDSKKCTKTTSLSITEPEVLKLSLVSQADPLCIGDKNGKISIKAVGGNNGGYTYTMDNSLSQRTGEFKELSQGEYTFKVVDRKACTDNITKVSLLWPKSLAASLVSSPPVCFGDAKGQIKMTLSGGVGGYDASMLNTDVTPDLTRVLDTFGFANLKAGIYNFKIKDQNGCQLTISQQLKEAEKIEDFNLPKDTIVCKEQLVRVNVKNAANTIEWKFVDPLNANNNASLGNKSELIVSKPGVYSVNITNLSGCVIAKQFELKNNNNALIADFLMTVQAFEGDTIYALDISKPTPDQIIWKLPAEANIIKEKTDGMIFKLPTEGTYTIEMIAKKGQCENLKIREIEIFKKENIGNTNGGLFYNDYDVIKTVNVLPNPNFGKFTLEVNLAKQNDISVVITRASNATLIYKEDFKGKAVYSIPIALKNFIQDNYLLTVKVGSAAVVKRILLQN